LRPISGPAAFRSRHHVHNIEVQLLDVKRFENFCVLLLAQYGFVCLCGAEMIERASIITKHGFSSASAEQTHSNRPPHAGHPLVNPGDDMKKGHDVLQSFT
jgi:hypothetical protein